MPRPRKRIRLTKSEQMARVRSRNTQPETLLRRALWARGLRYRIHAGLPGTPDVSFPAAKVAVFVDGCFWHGCPEHYTRPMRNSEFWDRKLSRNLNRDARVNAELEQAGWLPIRVWEHEIQRSLEQVVLKITTAVQARLTPNEISALGDGG
jgi:DNA mismatch endonuclease (patch repair protein)